MAATKPSLLIGTPCYNEAESLPGYLERTTSLLALLESSIDASVLLIDDGSTDATPKMLQGIAQGDGRFAAVHHRRNFGYGAAIKTALSMGLLNNADLVAFVDADSNYDQRDIATMLVRMADDVDIVNASIFAPGGAWAYPWYRMMYSRATAMLYAAVLGSRANGVYTFTCGFRLYRSRIIPLVFPQCDDFVATSEILVRSLGQGLRVLDVPVRNHPRRHGRTKLRTVRVARGHLLFLIAVLRGRVGEPDDPERHLARVGIGQTLTRSPHAIDPPRPAFDP